MQNYWNLDLNVNGNNFFTGPVDYRDFRETGPWTFVCCLVNDNLDGL